MGCGAFVLILFILLHYYPVRSDEINALEGKSIIATGYVDTIRYKNDTYQLLISKTEYQGQEISKKLYLYLKEENTLPKIGQKIRVSGIVNCYEEARNPGNFSMKQYYHIRNVDFYLKDVAILQRSKEYSIIKNALYQLRLRLERNIDLGLPERYADQCKAILLGNKDEIDSDIKGLYQKGGITPPNYAILCP